MALTAEDIAYYREAFAAVARIAGLEAQFGLYISQPGHITGAIRCSYDFYANDRRYGAALLSQDPNAVTLQALLEDFVMRTYQAELDGLA